MYHPLLHVVLYEPEIPDNTGNIGRTCVALGAKLWLVRPLGFRVEDRRLRRSGLDYWPYLLWEAVDNWAALCEQLDRQRMWFFTKHAQRCYSQAPFQTGDVLVFGCEARGLPAALLPDSADRTHADRCLRIPLRSEARSLNLSVAVAVAAYEAGRQIGLKLFPAGSR
jgi:tRNA (cytidine/uridine-2'-O-)-methyltransferase